LQDVTSVGQALEIQVELAGVFTQRHGALRRERGLENVIFVVAGNRTICYKR
jgi:hypothetical protein